MGGGGGGGVDDQRGGWVGEDCERRRVCRTSREEMKGVYNVASQATGGRMVTGEGSKEKGCGFRGSRPSSGWVGVVCRIIAQL